MCLCYDGIKLPYGADNLTHRLGAIELVAWIMGCRNIGARARSQLVLCDISE